jgi:pimeloyl-ACP methyl ester carboxylesterase
MTAEMSVEGLDRLHSEILGIFARLLETPDLSIDDDFFDKGGDSLLATELMLELRKFTGKALPDSLLFESSTVKALAQRLSQEETPRARVAVRIGAASDGAKPLLFFHGDWSWGGFYVEHLARKLGPEISLIAVAAHGAGGEPIPSTIEAMAADRLPAILAEQPTGPYRLAGHCVGGIVAFETARLLMKLNHRVETVVMIDSPVMVGGKAVKNPLWSDGDAGAQDPATAEDIPVRPATPFGPAFERYTDCLVDYAPAALPVRLLVFASEYDGRDWMRLSMDAELMDVPGDHFDLVTRRIGVLAGTMRSWLTTGDASPRPSERRPAANEKNDGSLTARANEREAQASPISAAKRESLPRRLRRLFTAERR